MKTEFNLEKFGAAVGLLIRERTGELQKQIDSLESRLAAVEMTGIRYRGVHQRALEYQRGDVVTANGSAWIAVTDHAKSLPGTDSSWQLMVKSGRS